MYLHNFFMACGDHKEQSMMMDPLSVQFLSSVICVQPRPVS